MEFMEELEMDAAIVVDDTRFGLKTDAEAAGPGADARLVAPESMVPEKASDPDVFIQPENSVDVALMPYWGAPPDRGAACCCV
jgi:hypothetical protein